MLTLEPARKPRRERTKIAIALAGGGVLGSFYEIGALHAGYGAIEVLHGVSIGRTNAQAAEDWLSGAV